MLQVVMKNEIKVATNAVQSLEWIPKLIELAHSGKIKGKGIVIIDRETVKRQSSGAPS